MQNDIFARQQPDQKMKFEFNAPRLSEGRRSDTLASSSPIDISTFYGDLCATSVLRSDLEEIPLRQVLRSRMTIKRPTFRSWLFKYGQLFGLLFE